MVERMNWIYVTLAVTAVSAGLIFVFSNSLIKLFFIAGGKFLSIPGVPIDPSSVLSLLWLPHLIRYHRKALFETGITLCILALAVGQALSILWSAQKLEGLRELSYTLAILTMFLVFSRPGTVALALRLFKIIAPVLLLSVASVALFRISPELERSYLQSGLAQLLIGPEAPRLFSDRPNNVLLNERAGGLFFVNSNRASMVLGVHAMLFLALSYHSRRPRQWWATAAVLLLGVFLTGSKTGLVLGLILTVAGIIMLTRTKYWALYATFGSLVGGVAYAVLAGVGKSDIDTTAYADSWSDRLPMWKAAASFLTESPILGLGFGGWKEEWGKVFWLYGKPASFPPHNSIISNYSDSGLVALVATIGIGVFSVYYLISTLRWASNGPVNFRNRATNVWSSAALVWAFVHSLGDNTSFYGVGMTMAAYGCALALLRSIKTSGSAVEMRDNELLKSAV